MIFKLKKYFFLVIILLLNTFANTFAKNNSQTFQFSEGLEVLSYETPSLNLDCFVFSSDENKHRNLLFSDVIDLEKTEENEEESNSHKVTQSKFLKLSPSNYYVGSDYFAFIEKPKEYLYSFKTTSVKLTIKFQVFRI
tara:strand:+ start:363 stop:776 length:414 start_codon:yes stop_codon:yes gene_type:complete